MKIKAFFVKSLGIVGRFLSILFNDVIHKELELLLPIAEQVVVQVASDPSLVTNDSKRQAAISAIGSQIAAKQLQIAGSSINLAIELSYQKYKDDQIKK